MDTYTITFTKNNNWKYFSVEAISEQQAREMFSGALEDTYKKEILMGLKEPYEKYSSRYKIISINKVI